MVFRYVAPEYAMTGHLLVKSDVYSYGVVLLELLSGRKPVDMTQPPGSENLVTWARPLLTDRDGLQQLVDPSMPAASYGFEKLAKAAAIASMCVHVEASHRPFMGEVVQALKLIYNGNNDETCTSGSFGGGGGGEEYEDEEASSPWNNRSWSHDFAATPPPASRRLAFLRAPARRRRWTTARTRPTGRRGRRRRRRGGSGRRRAWCWTRSSRWRRTTGPAR